MTTSQGWRVWISSAPLHTVQFLPGDAPLVAAWESPHRAHFFAPYDAAYEGALTLPQPPDQGFGSDPWRAYLAMLRAPNGAWLPSVSVGAWTLLTSHDGRFRVGHSRDHRLVVESDGDVTRLDRDSDASILALGLDRELGTIAALDAEHRLSLYQQIVAVGVYPITLQGTDRACRLALPDGLGVVLLGDARSIRIIDMAGQVQRDLLVEMPLTALAVSPDGSLIAVISPSLLRVCDASLVPVAQAAVRDLLADLDPLDDETARALPGGTASLGAVDVTDDGLVAFGLGGVLGVTHIGALEPLPRPQNLL